MKTIAIEDLVILTLTTFMENLAELGMKKEDIECDMWWRNLPYKKQKKITEKLIDIIKRDAKRFKKERKKVK